MGKSSSSTASKLRTTADAAVATWRECQAATEKAREQLRAVTHGNVLFTGHTLKEGLQIIVAKLAVAEAEDAERTAQTEAAAALDAADVAEGDANARACDFDPLRADLGALLDEEARLAAALDDVRRRRAARLGSAVNASDTIAARRQQASLPRATTHGLLHSMQIEGVHQANTYQARAALDALTIPTPASNAEKIRRLRHEELHTRAEIERKRLEADAKEAERVQREQAWQAARNAEAAAQRAKAEEWQQKVAREQREIEELAAAQKAREAAESGVSS